VTRRTRYALAAVLVLGAAAGGVTVWRYGSVPAAPRTVQVAVYGAQAMSSPAQPGIDYRGNGGMIPPSGQTTTDRRSPTDASVLLTTPAGQTRQTDQALPWQRTVTLGPGQQVSVSVRSAEATSVECMITVDGTQLAKQETTGGDTATCTARL
jgi:uncharacterized cupredoxin-like copper-binding protein